MRFKAPVFASAYRSSWPTRLAISRASALAFAGAGAATPKSPRSASRASRSACARIACGRVERRAGETRTGQRESTFFSAETTAAVRRSGGVGSARPREVWRWGRRGGGRVWREALAFLCTRSYIFLAGFGDAPPSGYSRGPPCPWPAPTSRSHRRRTPSGASARFGSPRSEASSGDRGAKCRTARAKSPRRSRLDFAKQIGATSESKTFTAALHSAAAPSEPARPHPA